MTRHTPSRTRETIEQLLSAIESRDLRAVERCLHPFAMAADYGLHAVLQRPGRAYAGWAAIADYFDTVPTRLGGAEVLFEPIEPLGKDQARVAWRRESLRHRHFFSISRSHYSSADRARGRGFLKNAQAQRSSTYMNGKEHKASTACRLASSQAAALDATPRYCEAAQLDKLSLRISSGIAPFINTASWNSRRSKRSPSFSSASSRIAKSASCPVL